MFSYKIFYRAVTRKKRNRKGVTRMTVPVEPVVVAPVVEPVAPVVEPKDAMIPKARFDEVNNKLKEMAGQVEEFQKAQAQIKADAEAKELEAKKEQGKYEELYINTQKELDSYKTYEGRATELETLIKGMVDTKLQSVPTDMVDLVPNNLNVEQTLDWLNKAESKGLFGSTKQEPKEIGKPSNKSNESPKVDSVKMSALDKILTGLGK